MSRGYGEKRRGKGFVDFLMIVLLIAVVVICVLALKGVTLEQALDWINRASSAVKEFISGFGHK